MRSIKEIVHDIKTFQPEHGEWSTLETLLSELWATGEQEQVTEELFKLFERFPENDGSGVLWSVLHGIETFKNYEQELVDSLRRQPSEMGVIMLMRIANTGTSMIAGIGVKEIAGELMAHSRTPLSVRETLLKRIKWANR